MASGILFCRFTRCGPGVEQRKAPPEHRSLLGLHFNIVCSAPYLTLSSSIRRCASSMDSACWDLVIRGRSPPGSLCSQTSTNCVLPIDRENTDLEPREFNLRIGIVGLRHVVSLCQGQDSFRPGRPRALLGKAGHEPSRDGGRAQIRPSHTLRE